jgi:hypothetical protein
VSDSLAQVRVRQRAAPNLDTCALKMLTRVYIGKNRIHPKISLAAVKYMAAGPAKMCSYFCIKPEDHPEFIATVTKFQAAIKAASKPVKDAADDAIDEICDVMLRDPEFAAAAMTATDEVKLARERNKAMEAEQLKELLSGIVPGDLISEVRGHLAVAAMHIASVKAAMYDTDLDDDLRRTTMNSTLTALSATLDALRTAADEKDPSTKSLALKRARPS